MIRKFMNTDVAKAASMLELDSKEILAMSKGVVSKLRYDEEDGIKIENVTATIDDPKIFGKLLLGEERKTKDEPMNMGHIILEEPVVNIHYYRGCKPRLARDLKISMKDLDRIIYGTCYVVIEERNTDLAYKQVLNEKEYLELKQKYGVRFVAELGAKAIEYLLEKEKVENRQYMILNCIPVLPLSMRYVYCSKSSACGGKEHYKETSLNRLYESVIMNNNRLRKLLEFNAPDIILRNERRMLQEKVDALINNGARGLLAIGGSYMPLDSMYEVYQYIVELDRPKYQIPKTELDVDALFEKIHVILQSIAEALRTYLSSHPFDPGNSDAETVLDQIYQAYAESHESDPPEISEGFRELEDYLDTLHLSDHNAVFHLCCHLCSAYEEKAFRHGLLYGAHLMAELFMHKQE